MPETDRSTDPEVLGPLFAPTLAQIRKSRVQAWGEVFGDDTLRDDIVANPRLARRITSQILADSPTPLRDTVIGSPDEAALTLVLDGAILKLSLMVGMAWHGPTVLEWITWNMLDEKDLRVPLGEARLAITSVPQIVRKVAGAPERPDTRVTAETLGQDGKALMQVWMGSLPKPVQRRLSYLIDLKPAATNAGQADFVRHVSRAILAEKG